jgi:hypothetical protein
MIRMCSVALVLAGASAALGQSAPPLRAFGVVRDSTRNPIAEAEVTAAGVSTRTDSLGRFTLRVTGGDSATITVRRVGFESLTFNVAIDTLDRNDLDIELQALPRVLPRVAVTAEQRARVPSIEGFEERKERKAGAGYFLSRKDLAEREGQPLTSIMRGVRGVTVNGKQIRFARWSGKGGGCAPHMWLDGMQVRDLELSEFTTRDIEAIEMYPNSSSAPAVFDSGSRFACGVIAIWTRRPILRTP